MLEALLILFPNPLFSLRPLPSEEDIELSVKDLIEMRKDER